MAIGRGHVVGLPRSRPALRAGVVARLLPRPDPLLVLVVAAYVLSWSVAREWWFRADAWLTFLAGREIAAGGIPHRDALAVMTHGDAWIDQQWLAQVFFWHVFRAGGLGLAALVALALLVSAFPAAFVFARRRGASALAVAPFAIVPAVVYATFLRAQVFSPLLFVLLLGLLAAESRRPTRRVLLAFPLLALWANLHGAVTVGVVLVALLGATELARVVRSRSRSARAWARPVLLALAPWAMPLATPYGLDMVGYYRATLTNPAFREFESEWMAPTFLSTYGLVVFFLACAGAYLVARRRRDLTPFELAALAFTFVGALTAVRSVPWFAYTCLVLLPPLVGRRREAGSAEARTRLTVVLAAAAALAAAVSAAALASASGPSLVPSLPVGAPRAVGEVLRADPTARVLAGQRYADWLLFELPELRGRIAFDGRFELLAPDDMRRVMYYLQQVGEDWERPSRGYRLLVLDTHDQARLVATYERRPSVRTLFRSGRVVVFDRGPQQAAR